jgi:hypothetical protein
MCPEADTEAEIQSVDPPDYLIICKGNNMISGKLDSASRRPYDPRVLFESDVKWDNRLRGWLQDSNLMINGSMLTRGTFLERVFASMRVTTRLT